MVDEDENEGGGLRFVLETESTGHVHRFDVDEGKEKIMDDFPNCLTDTQSCVVLQVQGHLSTQWCD
jgi:hypothetical protein